MSKYVNGIHEERFDLFLKDLRSGDFAQVRGHLESVGEDGEVVGRCCLGVACVRPAAEGVVRRDVSYYHRVTYDGNSAELPKVVADYLGIPLVNRTETEGDTDIKFYKSGYDDMGNTADLNRTAAGLNDYFKYDFNQIADAFELEFTKEA